MRPVAPLPQAGDLPRFKCLPSRSKHASASRACSDPGSAPESAKGSPTVLHKEIDYLSDKTVWIALAVALGGILLLALLLAITI